MLITGDYKKKKSYTTVGVIDERKNNTQEGYLFGFFCFVIYAREQKNNNNNKLLFVWIMFKPDFFSRPEL